MEGFNAGIVITRNTNYDRIVNTMNSLRKEDSRKLDKEIRELIDRIITIFSGILSSAISGILISIIKNENNGNKLNVLWTLIIFIVLLITIWFLCIKFIVPYMAKKLNKEIIDIEPDVDRKLLDQFHYDIMQKVAEVNEIVDVIQQTKISECKMLNCVLALYKLKDIVFFLDYALRNVQIRKSNKNGARELLDYCFNRYTVSAVVRTVDHIFDIMNRLLYNDVVIMNLSGYDLLKADFQYLKEKFDNFKDGFI